MPKLSVEPASPEDMVVRTISNKSLCRKTGPMLIIMIIIGSADGCGQNLCAQWTQMPLPRDGPHLGKGSETDAKKHGKDLWRRTWKNTGFGSLVMLNLLIC